MRRGVDPCERRDRPQGRVTDHRIGLTLHRLDAVLTGDLDEIMDALITEDQSLKLKNASA